VTLFLILAPYGAFAMLMLTSSATVSLFAAAAICLLAVFYDLMRGRSIKMLALGSAFIFLALGGYLTLAPGALSDSAVKLAVNTGVLAIAVVSLAIGRPFTLQYAREMADPETVRMPAFRAINYVITWVWALAILLMMLANVMVLVVPGLPLWSGLAIAFIARNIAIYFSRWYPEYRRARLAASPAATLSAA
jgi:hypothetical protein